MFLATLLFAIGAATTPAHTLPDTALTVMTYNVRFGTAQDGPNAWELRKDFLVRTVARHAPAILGTQECLDFQADYIVEHLPGYEVISLGREADGGGEMTAVFYNKSLLLPLESGHFWLSETPDVPGSKSWDSSLPRIATWVKFFDRTGARCFYYFNTHLDHRGEVARVESARLLLGRILRVESTVPAILTGDFNAAGGSAEPWTVLTSGGLTDLWDHAIEKTGLPNTWNGFEIPNPAQARRIDWILATPGVVAQTCEIDAVQEQGRYPSDHMPVIAIITLPPKV